MFVKVQMQGYGHTLGAAQVENLVKAKKKYDGDDDESMFVAAKMIEGESELVVVSLWHDLF